MVSQKNSTFFPALSPAVKMEEDDDEGFAMAASAATETPLPSASWGQQQQHPPILNDGYYLEENDVSDEEDVPPENRDSDAYRELLWLKRIRREKELEQQQGEPVVHRGFRCDGCSVEPIVGGRFQCAECLVPDTVDFCCECAAKGLEVGNRHKKSHVLMPVRRKKNAVLSSATTRASTPAEVDCDYLDSRNYLDPNFVK